MPLRHCSSLALAARPHRLTCSLLFQRVNVIQSVNVRDRSPRLGSTQFRACVMSWSTSKRMPFLCVLCSLFCFSFLSLNCYYYYYYDMQSSYRRRHIVRCWLLIHIPHLLITQFHSYSFLVRPHKHHLRALFFLKQSSNWKAVMKKWREKEKKVISFSFYRFSRWFFFLFPFWPVLFVVLPPAFLFRCFSFTSSMSIVCVVSCSLRTYTIDDHLFRFEIVCTP